MTFLLSIFLSIELEQIALHLILINDTWRLLVYLCAENSRSDIFRGPRSNDFSWHEQQHSTDIFSSFPSCHTPEK
jgi:hypothetical protein